MGPNGLSRDVQASVGVGAYTPFMLYGFTGGARKFGVHANFEADATSQPWTFTAGLDPSIGWDFDVPVSEVSSDGLKPPYLLEETLTFPIEEMAGDRTC
jgi:hypothetical protein